MCYSKGAAWFAPTAWELPGPGGGLVAPLMAVGVYIDTPFALGWRGFLAG